MRIAFCTIVAKNYLPFARVLMNSVRRYHPDALRVVVLVDEIEGYFDPACEPFELILSRDLDIPNSRWFHFKYTVLELCTAVKPWVLEKLFAERDLDSIVYLDPDIELYAPLDAIFDGLAGQTMVLTPHLTGRIEDDLQPSELDILRSGSYNLGFLALNRNATAALFLKWWQDKLYEHCVVDLPRGLFVDQRWMDLVPGMFPGVVIDRSPGNNVAYWNVGQREVSKTSEGYLVGGDRLRFFHFSGFDPINPELFSKHQNRFRLSRLGDAQALVLAYARQLINAGYAKCRKWPYVYGRFENGFPIPDMGRAESAKFEEIMQGVTDPFSVEGYTAFVKFWNEPIAGGGGDRQGVTRLAYRIYRCRPDVQAAMPDILGGDHRRFLEWMLSSAKSEHALSEVFLAPVREAVMETPACSAPGPEHEPTGDSRPANPPWFQLAATVRGASPDVMNQLVGEENNRLRLTRLAADIYESRPDLQQYLPDPFGRDGPKFLIWLFTYGAREYELSEVYLLPLRGQWEDFVHSMSFFHRVRHRATLLAATTVFHARARAARLAGAAKMWNALSRPRTLKPGLESGIDNTQDGRLPGVPARAKYDHPSVSEELPFGVNIAGYLRAETGVGESGRASLASARAAGLPTSATSVSGDGQYRETHPVDVGLESNNYAMNLLHVNADQSDIVARRLGDRYYKNHYNIGYWAWELEEFPERWQTAGLRYNEVWTPSRFCQDAIAQRLRIPVIRMPHAIAEQEAPTLTRSDLGLPPEGFLFLCTFDTLSIVERKNPHAAIAAFRSAFNNQPNVHLVLKVNNPQHRSDQVRALREAAGDSNVLIIDRTVSRKEMSAITWHCDCFVSLHRSEGFGLVIAEAMLMAKPVIVTAYSGNMDFTRPGNSLLVGYRLKPVGKGCAPYDEQCVWAEPRTEEAAGHMKSIFESEGLRRRIGSEARDCILTSFSPAEVGRRMRNRLEFIWTSVLRRPPRELDIH
jgi:glycosyltransferase involved in cell wall biosynthesis